MDPPLSAARTIAPRPFGRVPAIVVTLLAILSMRPAAAEEGFVDLFDGRSLDGWVAESHADSETHPDGRPVWSARDGEIVCDGLGFGFLRYARQAFADVTLRLEFLLGPSAEGSACNSGIGLRTGPFDRRRSRSTRPSIRSTGMRPAATVAGSAVRSEAPTICAAAPVPLCWPYEPWIPGRGEANPP